MSDARQKKYRTQREAIRLAKRAAAAAVEAGFDFDSWSRITTHNFTVAEQEAALGDYYIRKIRKMDLFELHRERMRLGSIERNPNNKAVAIHAKQDFVRRMAILREAEARAEAIKTGETA